jgi:hypothetical protein
VVEAQEKWNIPSNKPYLKHIKAISPTWPHLRLLADFMEISTTPLRWAGLNTKERLAAGERETRAKQTNVVCLDYLDNGEVVKTTYKTSEDLCAALDLTEKAKTAKRASKLQPWRYDPPVLLQNPNTGTWNHEPKCQFRLYAVEDLSRDVIEALGEKFDIEPAFFREQILDYTWYNIRDRWFDPPNLKMSTAGQRWLSFRFVTARYYNSTESFLRAITEALSFNVFRRPDDDLNNKSLWDDQNSLVGLLKARASLWMNEHSRKKLTVGMLQILLCMKFLKRNAVNLV